MTTEMMTNETRSQIGRLIGLAHELLLDPQRRTATEIADLALSLFPKLPGENDLRGKLLAEAARKQPRKFVQLDGFTGVQTWHTSPTGDDQGDALMGGEVMELRNGTPLRVQIEEDIDKETAIRLLEKMLGWLERNALARLRDMESNPPKLSY